MLFHVIGINTPASSLLWILVPQACTGHMESEIWVILFQLTELMIKNNIVCRSHAVEDSDLCLQVAAGRLSYIATKRRHARAARYAYQMLVRLIDWQEFAKRLYDG